MSKNSRSGYWEDVSRRQSLSGQSAAVFCRNEGVDVNQLYAWRCKQRKKAATNSSALVPVKIVESPSIEIDLPCGARMKVPANEETIRQVVSALVRLEVQ